MDDKTEPQQPSSPQWDPPPQQPAQEPVPEPPPGAPAQWNQPPQQPWNQQPPQQPWNQPPQQQPPQQPWSSPPQQPGPGWGQPGYYAAPPRPVGVTVTGVFFVIWGVLVALFGVLFLIGGQVLSGSELDIPGFGNLGGAVSVIGVFVLVLGILWLASGIGVFMAKQWARIIGIIMGVLGLIIFGLGTLGALSPGAGADTDGTGGLVFSLVVAALSAVAVWALVTAGPYFAARR